MAKLARWVPAVLLLVPAACAFLLDFDELQSGPGDAGPDSSLGGTTATGGTSGTSGQGGSSGGSGTGGIAGSDAGDGGSFQLLAGTTAEAICSKLSKCYGSAAMPLIFGDADCATYLTSLLVNSIFAPAVDSAKVGKITVDVSKVNQCLTDFANLSCGLVGFDFPETCRSVLEGKIDVGQKCSHFLECKPGLYCDLTGGCAGAVCAPYANASDPCSETKHCGAGLSCLNSKCVPLAKQGQPCKGTDQPDCEVGQLCFGSSDTKSGVCLDSQSLFTTPPNQPCSSWLDVFGDASAIHLCQSGSYCSVFSWTPKCLGGVAGTAGTPCEWTLPDQCPSGLFCTGAAPDAGTGNVCTPLPKNGQPCGPLLAAKGRCAAYHSCNGTTCVLMGNNGEKCSAASDCYSGVCDIGNAKCAPQSCPVSAN